MGNPWDPPANSDAPARVRHVWVKLDPSSATLPAPGLVLDWRRGEHGWEAFIVTVWDYKTRDGLATDTRMGWRPVHFLRPANGTIPPPDTWRNSP